MSRLESRIQCLEAASPPDDEEFPIFVVQFKPWCSVGRHPLPYGYLRGYHGLTQRKPGESEEDLYARALAIAKEKRGPRCGIALTEDRESVACTQCSGSVTEALPNGRADQ